MGRTSVRSMVGALDDALQSAGDAERAVREKAYLKSPLEHYGATVPAIRRAVSDAVARRGPLSRSSLLEATRRLWSGRVHEQRMAAVLLLEKRCELLEAEDLALLEEMIRGSFTWAYVDILAATVAGSLVERHPALAARLDYWATDECFWLRRAALLALMGPLRQGGGDWRRFRRLADGMLEEKEFFVRKAIGWVLRETSKKQPDRVEKYVRQRLAHMSGITFREAVKRLPEERQKALRHAWRSARG